MEQVELPGFCTESHATSSAQKACAHLRPFSHTALTVACIIVAVHGGGWGVDVGELGGWDGEGMEGEGGSPSATGPLLPSNSPHFAFLRPSLPLLLLSLSPSHLFPKFFHFLLLKAKKNQKPTTPSTPSLVLPPPKSPFPPKNNSHLSSSLPSNSPHFAFPPLCSMLEGGARGSPRLPQVHLFL